MKKLTKRHENFIIDKMIEDKMLPAHVFKKHKEELPSLRTFNRRIIDDPSFRDKVNAAYEVIFDDLHSQLEEISTMSATQAIRTFGNITDAEDVDFKEAAEFKKSRIDTLKFSLAKLASVLSRKYNVKQTIEHTGQVESSFVFSIPDYSQTVKTIDVDDDSASSEQDSK